MTPIARTGMLIRKPAAEVFDAFVDPAVTKRFWFSRSTGHLEPGRTVEWEWTQYGLTVPVTVTDFERPSRLAVTWGAPDGRTRVEWRFVPHGPGATFVELENGGFAGTDEAKVEQALDSVGGFSLVLAGLKAFLEHGIELNLVSDRHPDRTRHA